ncbi:retention module-containing protein [Campylobacter sp. 19-13652]|uniref:retention module-containing protein n=1 Tax=Campylobacter sp. 19-13652 TaxID=2840180 RepID=UPI001C741323|nr:retention module-containing protein [Campylobacter sp. 19-13652]BCX78710.1 hypothetical protein LBC_01720 [Campylobacter sp. 19-13652]
MANEAIVKSLKGKAFLQDAKGNVKELEVGDLVNLGDNIYPEGADEASFVLNLPNDKTLEVKDTKSFTLTQEALDGVAASDNADELNDIQKAILAGENLDELDATAAGGAPAAGGGGGVSLGAAGFDAGGHYANVNASMGQLGAGVGTDAVTASTPISGYNPQGGGYDRWYR